MKQVAIKELQTWQQQNISAYFPKSRIERQTMKLNRMDKSTKIPIKIKNDMNKQFSKGGMLMSSKSCLAF